MTKEIRIRDKGLTYVKEPGTNGKLYNITDVKTTILNVDLDTRKVTCR